MSVRDKEERKKKLECEVKVENEEKRGVEGKEDQVVLRARCLVEPDSP